MNRSFTSLIMQESDALAFFSKTGAHDKRIVHTR